MRTVSGVPVGGEEGRASKGHRTPCAKAGNTNAMGLGRGIQVITGAPGVLES